MDQSRIDAGAAPAPRRELQARQPPRHDVCESHGEYIARNLVADRWTSCPACDAEVRAKWKERERELLDLAAQESTIQRRRQLRQESGVIGRFREVSFETFRTQTTARASALKACRAFVDNSSDDEGLWLLGPPGTGKTHLGCAMVNYVIDTFCQPAAIHSAREIVRMLRATWAKRDPQLSNPPRTEEEVIHSLGSAALLVLDEVGLGFGSDSEIVQLFDVLDLRYRNDLPTVLLSNLTPREIKRALGDRLYDRLREGSRIVPCDWESFRGTRASAEARA